MHRKKKFDYQMNMRTIKYFLKIKNVKKHVPQNQQNIKK